MAVADDGEVVGSVSGGCVEGAVVDRGARRPRVGRARGAHVRLQRRRGLRRRPHLRRHRSTSSSSRSTGERRCSTGSTAADPRPAGRWRWRRCVDGDAGPAPSCSSRPDGTRPTGHARRPRPRPGRRAATPSASSAPAPPACATTAPTARPAQDEVVGLHRVVRPAAAHADLRRRRLHRRPRPGGQGARLPRHRVRRPAGVRHHARFPLADEVVVDWPHRLLERVGPDAHAARRGLRPHPRPQVRRARDRRRPRHRRRLPRRHGQPPHPRRAPRAPARRGRRPTPSSPGCTRPSASTSAPARPRRPPSPSAPRSSPIAPARRTCGRCGPWRARSMGERDRRADGQG